jgi:3'(2'), 5'-bisphosphate nucleotidase
MFIEIEPLLTVAVKAGEAILSIYNDVSVSGSVQYKADKSPLTLADTLSHNRIVADLKLLHPDIPILSEEGADIPYEVRKTWEYYWCVDPLDGTKEFINRNGEFTVNIALIHKDTPVLGIIYVPCKDTLYYGNDKGSFKKVANEKPASIKAVATTSAWVSVGSRSHADGSEAAFLSGFPVTEQLTAGSSLKFCLVAEGKAQIYFRNGPTMEWDTAAGHAIAVNAGAIMQTPQGQPFVYNKPSLLNSGFVCRVKLPAEG